MTLEKTYDFSAKMWRYGSLGLGGWYFVSLPKALSKKVRQTHQTNEEGWGRLPLKARINNTEWATAIWFDTKQNTYLLPIKSTIRKKEKLTEDSKIQVRLIIQIQPE